jgi:hypothetical protein
MGFMEYLNEQFYILFSIYYYEVFLYKNNIQVTRIIQSVSFSPTYIIDFKGKRAFLIIAKRGFIKGHKIILHYDIDRAIPLKEIQEVEVKEINENIIENKKVTKLVGDITKEQKEKASPLSITPENLPPHMVFEIMNGGFVTKTLAPPKSTDWTMVILAVCFVIGILGFIGIMVFGLK